jgi:hypothetical protein
MPGGAVGLVGPVDVNRVEAPVTVKAYLLCAFAAFGGVFLYVPHLPRCSSVQPNFLHSGYDSGYINGVTGSSVFIELIEGPGATKLTGAHNSLITSILSAGTFFGVYSLSIKFGFMLAASLLTNHPVLSGALIAGDCADWFGRRPTIIAGCVIYTIGCILQAASHGLALIVAGRLVAGVGVGFVSAIIILYMSEICPRKVRGALVSGYQFCKFPLTFPPLTPISFFQRYYHWSPCRIMRHLCHREAYRYRLLSHSHQHPICLGSHPWYRSLPSPRVPSLLRQTRRNRQGTWCPLQTSWSTPQFRIHRSRTR